MTGNGEVKGDISHAVSMKQDMGRGEEEVRGRREKIS